MSEFYVEYSVVCLTVAFCTLHYFYSFLRDPAKFAHQTMPWRRLNPFRRVGLWIYSLAAWFGFGFMIRAGLIGALSWIPGSWFRIDDAGWLPVVVAILTSILVVARLNEIGKSMAKKEQAEASPAAAE